MAIKCCADVRICDLRHKITVQAPTPSTDAGGGQSDQWDSPIQVLTARACIEPLKGTERLRAMQLENPVTHKITIRYRSGIVGKHRILFEGRIFNIRAIIDLEERHKWLQIMAEEGVAT